MIKNWPTEDFLYTVFLRLNTGSKKLSPQELRQALHPGEFLDFLDLATSKSEVIRKMLNNKKPDPRMKDIELTLRFIAYKLFLNDYKGNLKAFLDTACLRLNTDWENKKDEIIVLFGKLEQAIIFCQEIFSERNAFARYINNKRTDRFNRSIFELLTYYFSIPKIRAAIKQNPQSFVTKFAMLNEDAQFVSAVSDTTKEIGRIGIRFGKMFDLIVSLPELQGSGISIPKISVENSALFVSEHVV